MLGSRMRRWSLRGRIDRDADGTVDNVVCSTSFGSLPVGDGHANFHVGSRLLA